MAASTMLRIHFMQQWYALSDPAMEDALYEIESMRRFAGVELNVTVSSKTALGKSVQPPTNTAAIARSGNETQEKAEGRELIGRMMVG